MNMFLSSHKNILMVKIVKIEVMIEVGYGETSSGADGGVGSCKKQRRHRISRYR
jgi:hypothetical protein